MIDLLTHVLPGWDDGAADVAEAERMIAAARKDGISTLVLTPHVYRKTKHGNDVRNLKAHIRAFLEQTKSRWVDLFQGAEVRFHHDMISHIKEFGLTIKESDYVLIEFPAKNLPEGTPEMVHQLMLAGLIPIICHPERNAVLTRSPEILYELIKQGALGQVTALSITGGFGIRVRKAAEGFLRHGLVHLIASDAHNGESRSPRLSDAVIAAAKVVGMARAEAMVTTVPAAILANEQIPDLGEAVIPSKQSWLSFIIR